MMWPPTLWDEIEALDGSPEARAALLDTVAVYPGQEVRPTMSVTAPCCGRRTAADTVIDARGVPGSVVRGVDLPYLCDACWTRMIRSPDNGWTRSKWWRALGADAETIRQHRAREVAEQAIQRARDAGEGYRRHELVQEALSGLPSGVRDLPGTERPPITGS